MKSFEQVLNQEKNELTEVLTLFGEEKRVNKALADLEMNRPEFYKFYKAGQQSKQAEIDKLQKRINDALKYSGEFYDFGDGESAMAFCNEIMNILKGNTNDH